MDIREREKGLAIEFRGCRPQRSRTAGVRIFEPAPLKPLPRVLMVEQIHQSVRWMLPIYIATPPCWYRVRKEFLNSAHQVRRWRLRHRGTAFDEQVVGQNDSVSLFNGVNFMATIGIECDESEILFGTANPHLGAEVLDRHYAAGEA